MHALLCNNICGMTFLVQEDLNNCTRVILRERSSQHVYRECLLIKILSGGKNRSQPYNLLQLFPLTGELEE